MTIALDEATLISTFVGCILFGVFTVLFIGTMYTLIYKRKKLQRLNKPIIAVAAVLYMLALMHIILAILRTFNGFIRFTGEGGPSSFFLETANPVYVLQIVSYAVETLIGDLFLIYRLYMVWNKDKRLLIPALICWVGCLVATTGALYGEAHASPTTPIFVFKPWITSFFTITLFTNFTCTALIALRIWMIEKQTSAFIRTRSMSPVAVVVVESGAIYSVSLISLLATYLSGNWSQYIVLDSVVHIIGITFSIIIIRIGLGISAEETATTMRSRMNTSNQTSDSHQLRNFQKNVVAVQVSQDRTVKDDNGKSVKDSYGSTTAFDDEEFRGGSHSVLAV